MADLKGRIDELARLMDEFGLEASRLEGEDWLVEFSRKPPGTPVAAVAALSGEHQEEEAEEPIEALEIHLSPANPGIPITSPMTGIYYGAPNPGAPPFVKEGERVEAGQVVGLIEAMKVFNEITATMSGVVVRIEVENGRLVQPGDPLLYIA